MLHVSNIDKSFEISTFRNLIFKYDKHPLFSREFDIDIKITNHKIFDVEKLNGKKKV